MHMHVQRGRDTDDDSSKYTLPTVMECNVYVCVIGGAAIRYLDT